MLQRSPMGFPRVRRALRLRVGSLGIKRRCGRVGGHQQGARSHWKLVRPRRGTLAPSGSLDRALQGPSLEQRLFRLLARGVVGANEQIADDDVLRVAQRRDGHHRPEPAPILADIGQLVDVLDPTRGLEDQGPRSLA
jgi:hypothetical protein